MFWLPPCDRAWLIATVLYCQGGRAAIDKWHVHVCNGADIHNVDKVKWIDVKTKCTYENVEVIETILGF